MYNVVLQFIYYFEILMNRINESDDSLVLLSEVDIVLFSEFFVGTALLKLFLWLKNSLLFK